MLPDEEGLSTDGSVDAQTESGGKQPMLNVIPLLKIR
jgi:hypothetical protein